MKNLIISCIIVLVFIVGWLSFDYYSQNAVNSLCDILEDNIIPLTEENSWGEVALQYEDFEKEWNQYKAVALYFLENDKLVEIDLCIARAEKYIEAEDVSNSAGEVSSISKQIQLLTKREKVTLSNIL